MLNLKEHGFGKKYNKKGQIIYEGKFDTGYEYNGFSYN